MLLYQLFIVHKSASYIWVIDQVYGQDGWILAKFFFCVVMDRESRSMNTLKKRSQYPTIKHLLYEHYFLAGHSG